MNSTTTPTATGTRTRTRKRAKIVPAAMAGRQAQRRLAELAPKGRAPYAVLLAILTEISMYSRLDDRMSIRRIMNVSGLDRRSAQRGLAFLVDHGIVARIHEPAEAGKGTPKAWIIIPSAPGQEGDEIEPDDADEAIEADVIIKPEGVTDDTPGASPMTPGGGVTHDAPYEETFFTRSLSEKCVGCGNEAACACEVGRSDGPPSHPPGEVLADGTQITGGNTVLDDLADTCPDAQRAALVALERQQRLLAGGAR